MRIGITGSREGRKIATLIDKFGYFNKNDQFKHRDYHEDKEHSVHNPSEVSIENKYMLTSENSEFHLAEDNDIILHTIPKELF